MLAGNEDLTLKTTARSPCRLLKSLSICFSKFTINFVFISSHRTPSTANLTSNPSTTIQNIMQQRNIELIATREKLLIKFVIVEIGERETISLFAERIADANLQQNFHLIEYNKLDSFCYAFWRAQKPGK